jgi:hypothetical protein
MDEDKTPRITKIKIGDYIFYADGLCMWITQSREYINKKTGKISIIEDKVAGYSPNFETLLISFVTKKSMVSTATEVKELLQDLARIESDLIVIAKELGRKVDKNVKK